MGGGCLQASARWVIRGCNLPLMVMSEEQLKAFLEAVKADAELQVKLNTAEDDDAVVAIAKGAGFLISADELQWAQEKISEKELEGVTGGINFRTPTNWSNDDRCGHYNGPL